MCNAGRRADFDEVFTFARTVKPANQVMRRGGEDGFNFDDLSLVRALAEWKVVLNR
jgi:hypothetical protein